MAPQLEPGSVAWYVERLNARLNGRQDLFAKHERYYQGNHPLSELPARVPPDAASTFRRWQASSRANFMGIVIESLVERLEPQGIRYGAEADADADAWAMWQANHMDVGAEMVHTDAAVYGESFVLVAPNPDRPDRPFIYPEHPTQVIVDMAPGRPTERRAAFKKWEEDDGFVYGMLYLPESVVPVRSKAKVRKGSKIQWEFGTAEENPLGRVPIVPFFNKRRTIGGGVSEIADVTDSQDRINRTLFQRMVAAEYASFRQRAVSGLDVEYDEETGQAKMPFSASMWELWVASDPETRWHEFSATDLKPFIEAVEADVRHIATETRTPPHYLLGAMVNISGDALKAAESGLVSKVKRHQVHFGESWEEVFSLGFLAQGDLERADVTDAEIIWKNPEFRTEGELVDALVKMATLGVPRDALWERWGASPTERARWSGLQTADDFITAALNPAPAAVPAAIETTSAPVA